MNAKEAQHQHPDEAQGTASRDIIRLPLAPEADARDGTVDLASAAETRAALVRVRDGSWGLVIQQPGLLSVSQARPVRIEMYDLNGDVREYASGYESVVALEDGALAKAVVHIEPNVVFTVEDRWTYKSADSALRLDRTVTVRGTTTGGFLSAFTLLSAHFLSWADVDPFAPGMLYGHSPFLTGTAIGGVANYVGGVRQVRIREDRLPAPVFGLCAGDGTSLTLLDPAPTGDTSTADAHDVEGTTLIDDRFQFAALGSEERDGRLALGMWFPGAEGAVTYKGNTYPYGQLRRWRGRYHPIRDGLTQRYSLGIRWGRDERLPEYRKAVWRWAWETLKPAVVAHDIEAVRRAVVATLAERVMTVGDRAGVPLVCDTRTLQVEQGPGFRALMGFVGANVEAAYFLLREASRRNGQESERYRELGTAILDSFARLPVSPPQAEGFSLSDGRPAVLLSDLNLVHLRALCEGGTYMLKAWQHDATQGRSRPQWLTWGRALADWLLTQEHPSGGFPRAFRIDGADASSNAEDPRVRFSWLPTASYSAIPFLVLVTRVTSDRAYLDAAIRTGNFLWADGQRNGVFVGGTLDNPNVIDKEAGTISLEAYLSLYEATHDEMWLRRASVAGDYAETWIYLWNVPMAADDDDATLHWKKGVPTIGLQLIASGHSLVDAWMAWDVDSYARLYRYTGDAHYLEVARLLLHNTKAMLALPGRTYDLAGPGWQQEHWSLAPCRGYGLHRKWLPWVSCSHLAGIVDMEDFDPALFAQIAGNVASA